MGDSLKGHPKRGNRKAGPKKGDQKCADPKWGTRNEFCMATNSFFCEHNKKQPEYAIMFRIYVFFTKDKFKFQGCFHLIFGQIYCQNKEIQLFKNVKTENPKLFKNTFFQSQIFSAKSILLKKIVEQRA